MSYCFYFIWLNYSNSLTNLKYPGWWYTYPSEKSWSSSQLRWWHSQYIWKVIKFHGSSHHQPVSHTTLLMLAIWPHDIPYFWLIHQAELLRRSRNPAWDGAAADPTVAGWRVAWWQHATPKIWMVLTEKLQQSMVKHHWLYGFPVNVPSS